MGIPSETGLTAAFNALTEGDPRKAKAVLEHALSNDLENRELLFALKCVNFWCDIIESAQRMTDAYRRAELLLDQWKRFTAYIRESGETYEQSLYAVRKAVCTSALESYCSMLNEKNKTLKAEILSKAGLCNKLLGDYEAGIRFFQDANTLSPNCADILAEMADCYALCGQEKTAKVLFREAFFIDPQKVDNSFLESELFCRLAERTAQAGFSRIRNYLCTRYKSCLRWLYRRRVVGMDTGVRRAVRRIQHKAGIAGARSGKIKASGFCT